MGLELLDLRIKQLILEFESQNTAKKKSFAPGILDEFQLHLPSLFFRNTGIT